MSTEQTALINRARDIMESADSAGTGLQRVCSYVQATIPGCDWVGFYIAIPGTRELALGPYAGEATEHLRIPFGRGICGQAAEAEHTIVVDNVSTESNYLACSPNVRSEVVIPVFHEGELVGEFDIDSHTEAAFDQSKRGLLERITDELGSAVASLRPETEPT